VTEAESPETGFSVETLLVRQVKGLVSATADLIAESTGEDPLKIEASLFKLLAVNCEEAERLAEAISKAEPEDLATDHSEGETKP
jgi:hypothetical protein